MSLIPQATILDIDLSSLMTMGMMEPKNNEGISTTEVRWPQLPSPSKGPWNGRVVEMMDKAQCP